MSPVAPRKERNPRTVALGLIGVVVGIVLLLVVFVFAIPSLTESGNVEGEARHRHASTPASPPSGPRPSAADGPILFSDVASGQNDIYLQHLGDDDATGLAGLRRPPHRDQPRLHARRGTSDGNQFTDPCDGTVVPADGSGLKQYQVVVTESGTVVINLDPDNPIPSSHHQRVDHHDPPRHRHHPRLTGSTGTDPTPPELVAIGAPEAYGSPPVRRRLGASSEEGEELLLLDLVGAGAGQLVDRDEPARHLVARQVLRRPTPRGRAR